MLIFLIKNHLKKVFKKQHKNARAALASNLMEDFKIENFMCRIFLKRKKKTKKLTMMSRKFPDVIKKLRDDKVRRNKVKRKLLRLRRGRH